MTSRCPSCSSLPPALNTLIPARLAARIREAINKDLDVASNFFKHQFDTLLLAYRQQVIATSEQQAGEYVNVRYAELLLPQLNEQVQFLQSQPLGNAAQFEVNKAAMIQEQSVRAAAQRAAIDAERAALLRAQATVIDTANAVQFITPEGEIAPPPQAPLSARQVLAAANASK